jgi:hypothetical protein
VICPYSPAIERYRSDTERFPLTKKLRLSYFIVDLGLMSLAGVVWTPVVVTALSLEAAGVPVRPPPRSLLEQIMDGERSAGEFGITGPDVWHLRNPEREQ